jgi:hypothetical protein
MKCVAVWFSLASSVGFSAWFRTGFSSGINVGLGLVQKLV